MTGVGETRPEAGCYALQTVPNSHPESTSSDDTNLPSLAKFLSGPSSRSKLASRLSKVAGGFESGADSEELEIASPVSSSGL